MHSCMFLVFVYYAYAFVVIYLYVSADPEGNFMNDSPGKKKQVHASDNEPSSQILSRSNNCESFPDHGKSVVTVPDSEEVQAGHSAVVHENTAIDLLDQLETRQLSLMPGASSSFPEAAQALVDAIRKNRAYQKFLRGKLVEIEATIEQNEKHKKNVKIVKDFQASCKRITKQALSQRKDPCVELISTRKSGPCDNSEVMHFHLIFLPLLFCSAVGCFLLILIKKCFFS